MNKHYVTCQNWKDAEEYIKLAEEHNKTIIKVEESQFGTIKVYHD